MISHRTVAFSAALSAAFSCAILLTACDGEAVPVGGGPDSGADVSSDASHVDDAPADTPPYDAPDTEGRIGVDITDAVFSNMSPDCADHVGTYTSFVTDVNRGISFTGSSTITDGGTDCLLTANSIPNHSFNDGRSFASDVAEVTEMFTIPGNPSANPTATELSLAYDNGVFLNGVKLDALAAACYGVGNEPLGEERIGCFQAGTPWRYDPMYSGNGFGTDSHNAHTQPGGAYHYHGSPEAMFDLSGTVASPVIGFAADGFPIYGPFFDDNGTVRRAVSGWTLITGERRSQSGEGAFPGGTPDGTYRDDYEFTDAGDLDECNGMIIGGSYGYFVTDTYPWVIGCFRGTPDESFRKAGP